MIYTAEARRPTPTDGRYSDQGRNCQKRRSSWFTSFYALVDPRREILLHPDTSHEGRGDGVAGRPRIANALREKEGIVGNDDLSSLERFTDEQRVR